MTNSNSGFFGIDEYVSYGVVSDLNAASQVTCAFLARANGSWLSTHYFLASGVDSFTPGPLELFAFGLGANLTLTASVNSGNSTYEATIARPANDTWKFLVFTFNAGVGTWYVDGAAVVTTQFWGGDVALNAFTDPLLIGSAGGGNLYPSENIDVFGIWNAFVASAVNVTAMWTGTDVNHPYDTVVGVSTPTREVSFDGTLNSSPAGWVGTAGNHSGASTFAYQAPGPTTDASTQLSISPTTLPNGRVGTAYNQTLTATTEGAGAYTWSIIAGALPTGLTLSGGTAQTTSITGTPTTIGTYNFTVNVARGGATDGQQAYTVDIDPGVITITPVSLSNSTVGALYSETLTATGGTGAATWSVSVGVLPGGLSLGAASGIISGTPTTIETQNFTIRATKDAGNYAGTRAYTVSIGAAALAISPGVLPNPTYQDAYLETLTATGGGAGPYTWSISAGSLPTGLTLNASVTASTSISGTPSVRATFSFTVRVTDGVLTFDQPYTVTVQPTVLTILPVTARQAAVGLPYSETFTATGGPGSPTWVLTGVVPGGLAFNALTGVLSGTPTTIESVTFNISATEGGGDYAGDRDYTVSVNTFDAITPPVATDGDVGVPYTFAMTSADVSGLAHLWSIVEGSLPPGLALDGSTTNTSSIIGTPSSGGTYTFTVGMLIPDDQLYGEQEYTIHVLGGIVVSPVDVSFYITIERLS